MSVSNAAVEADLPVHFVFMTSADYIVAACGVRSRFDANFRSAEKRDDVTCPDCLANTTWEVG